MRSQRVFSGLLCLTAMAYASPIGSPVDDRSSPHEIEKRNILVPGYLIPTTAPNPATWSGSQTVSPDRLPTSSVNIATDSVAKRDAPVTIDGIVYPTGFPDLVPTSEVNLATDTTGTRTISPLLMPTVVATVGTTSGCIVTMKSRSYVTHCAHTRTPTPTSTGISKCCGGEDDTYPCNSDGSMPTGTTQWTCTFGSTSCAGTFLATTTWT